MKSMHAELNRRSFLAGAAGALGAAALPGTLFAEAASTDIARELLVNDGIGLAKLIRSGQVSQQEVVEASIARIEALDSKINAMTTHTFDRARNRMQEISADSVFAGVPTVLKDLVDLGGVRRTSGSLLHMTYVPKQSVNYVKAMESAGLNILGMTNTPEFASLGLTDNAAFGPTRNPWSLEHTAGGSSGGSAAAVAAGYVPLAHGTDGGGSNRIPASCCGVLGMKASRYRQVSGEADGGHQYLRTHQCISRSVRDNATLFALTEDHKNRAGYPPAGLIEGPGKKRLRIALTANNCLGQEPVAAVDEVLNNTAKLCQSLGHEVVEVDNPLSGEELFSAVEAVMLADMPQLLAAVESLTGKRAEEAGILTRAMVSVGRYSESLPAGAKTRGMAYLQQLTNEFSKFFKLYDVWLTPVLPMETPRVGYVTHNTGWEKAQPRNRQLMSYTALANCIGAPAMSVPLFNSSATGLPIGSHFLAAPGADRTLYELAFELEEAQPWKATAPDLPG